MKRFFEHIQTIAVLCFVIQSKLCVLLLWGCAGRLGGLPHRRFAVGGSLGFGGVRVRVGVARDLLPGMGRSFFGHGIPGRRSFGLAAQRAEGSRS